MKKNSIRVITGLLILCMAFAWLLPMSAAAAQSGASGQRWNIMLVIDGSGSLVDNPQTGRRGTDHGGMRYEAVSGFLSVLQDSGHNVGSIVFSGNKTGKDTDEAMRGPTEADVAAKSGLSERDIIMKLQKIRPISGQSDKDTLYEGIVRDKDSILSAGLCTDIGTALLMAEEELEAMNNGLPGAIYLFTDGKTEFEGKNQNALMLRSNANRDLAIDKIQSSGTKLCGALLNKDGKTVGSEAYLKDIVSRANGVELHDPALNRYFKVITDSVSCIDTIDMFLQMLGFGFADAEDKDEFLVPGVGVEEVSISLRGKNGSELPEGVSVTLQKPDGSKIDGSTLMAAGSKTLKTYKIQNPECGLWKINVVRPEDSTVEIGSYVFVSNSGLVPQLKTNPDIPQVLRGQPLSIECCLEQNGAPIAGADSYKGYQCTLSMTDSATGETKEYPLNLDAAAGTFALPWQFDNFCEYDVSVRFDLGEEYSWENVKYESAPQHWVIANHLPKLAHHGLKKNCIYSLFFGRKQTIDLTDFAVDDEDGANLTYSATGDGKINMDGVTLEGTQLKIRPKVAGSGSIRIHVEDADGGVSVIFEEIASHSITWLLILLLVVILVVAGFVAYKFFVLQIWPQGTCQLNMTIEDWGGFGPGKLELDVSLAPPGFNGTKHNTNLYEMLRCDMADEYSAVKRELRKRGISEDVFEQQLMNSQKLLEGYKIRCITRKQKDEDGITQTVALLEFQDSANKSTTELGTGMPAMVHAATDSQAIAITFDYQPD